MQKQNKYLHVLHHSRIKNNIFQITQKQQICTALNTNLCIALHQLEQPTQAGSQKLFPNPLAQCLFNYRFKVKK